MDKTEALRIYLKLLQECKKYRGCLGCPLVINGQCIDRFVRSFPVDVAIEKLRDELNYNVYK